MGLGRWGLRRGDPEIVSCWWLSPCSSALDTRIRDTRRIVLRDWSEDSIIVDFEWFANTSDYDFSPEGQPWYNDFGWNPELFPSPTRQLEKYRSDSISEFPDLPEQELLIHVPRISMCVWLAFGSLAWAIRSQGPKWKPSRTNPSDSRGIRH